MSEFEKYYENFSSERRRYARGLLIYLPLVILFLSLANNSRAIVETNVDYINSCIATWSNWHGWQCGDGDSILQWYNTDYEMHYSINYGEENVITLRPRNYLWIALYGWAILYVIYWPHVSIGLVSLAIGLGWRIAWFVYPKHPHYNAVLVYCDAFTSVLLCIDIIPYFKHLLGLKIVWNTLLYGFSDSIIILLIMMNFYIAFAMAFHIIYGGTLIGYSTYSFSLQQLLTVTFGGYVWEYPAKYSRYVTYLMWPAVIIILSMTLQNVYIAIFAKAFAEASVDCPINKKMAKYQTTMYRTMRTYWKLYVSRLAGDCCYHVSLQVSTLIKETIGTEIVNKYLHSEDNYKLVLIDLFEQYKIFKELTTLPVSNSYDYTHFSIKFDRLQEACRKDAIFTPLYLSIYAVSIIFSYAITDHDNEFRISSKLFNIDLENPMNGAIMDYNRNLTCQINNGIVYGNSAGTFISGHVPSALCFAYILPIFLIYLAAGFWRRSKYMMLVSATLLSHLIVRIIVIRGSACKLPEIQTDKVIGGIVLVLESIGILMIFSTNRRVRFLYCVYLYAIDRLRYILVFFVIIIFGFATSAFLLFRYDNFADALALTFNTITDGNSNFSSRYIVENRFAIFWYISLALVGTFVVYNMIIATVAEAYFHAAKKIYDTSAAKRALSMHFRLPLEFLYFCQKGETGGPECQYQSNAFIEHAFGRENAEKFYTETIIPTLEKWPRYLHRHVENELWLRALEIKHVIST